MRNRLTGKLLFAAFSTLVVLAGCQSVPQIAGNTWKPTIGKDDFTDQITKMVTVSESSSNNFIVTHSLKFYPFVGVQNGDMYVGIRSGGRYRMPTGTVQLRIDDHNSWTISPDETPIYLTPNAPTAPITTDAAANSLIQTTQAQAMANVARLMSPYTATTGTKAKEILRQMLNGKVIKYRIVGYNQAASTTGEIKIDESFVASLRAIGIKPEEL